MMESETEYVPIDDLPDLPDCRVLATADPAGLIRFEVTKTYAEALLESVRQSRAAHDGDGLLHIVFPMDYPAYASLTKGFAQLHTAPEMSAKQVQVDPDGADIAISVAINESQIESSMRKNYAALKQFGAGRMYGQQFGISESGAVLLIQQLEAALDGHENPLDAVDTEDDRFANTETDPQ